MAQNKEGKVDSSLKISTDGPLGFEQESIYIDTKTTTNPKISVKTNRFANKFIHLVGSYVMYYV